jgi:hypothetical protein
MCQKYSSELTKTHRNRYPAQRTRSTEPGPPSSSPPDSAFCRVRLRLIFRNHHDRNGSGSPSRLGFVHRYLDQRERGSTCRPLLRLSLERGDVAAERETATLIWSEGGIESVRGGGEESTGGERRALVLLLNIVCVLCRQTIHGYANSRNWGVHLAILTGLGRKSTIG